MNHPFPRRGALKATSLGLFLIVALLPLLGSAVPQPAREDAQGYPVVQTAADAEVAVEAPRETVGRRAYLPPSPDYPEGAGGLDTHRNTADSDPPTRRPMAGYNRTIGDHKALMLLVDFQDVTHASANNRSKYDAMANANGSTDRSMRTFYYENSAGNYTLNVTVIDWVTMPMNMANYSTPTGENKIGVDAATAADSAVDFSLFDEDGDGYVDNLIVVHAGDDQAVSGNTNDIWSFEGTGNSGTFDGKTVRRFMAVAEDTTNGDPLGVLCHEFGHLGFDLPDLYDGAFVNAGLGDWDTMAYGGWAGGGDQPNGFSAWTKLHLSWIDPYVPQSPVDRYTIFPMTNISSRNPVKIASNFSNEYFLIEFRWRNTSLRFDRYVPTSGLVIYHVNETTIVNNRSSNSIEDNTEHKGIDIEEVGTQDMDVDPTNTGSSNDVWINNTSGFGPSSTPNSNLYRNSSSYVTGIRVFNISTVNVTGGPRINFSIDPGRGSTAISGAVVGNASHTVQPGATANFTVQFTTASSSGDNLTLSTEGTFGGANVSLNRTNLTLASLGSGNVTLSVTLPANCTGGTYVEVVVRANSTVQTSNTFTVNTRTTCAQVYAGNLSGPTALNGTVGQMVGQNFTVRNTGNGPDFFALNVSVNASQVNGSLNITGFYILSGLNATFRLNYTVAGSVADGTAIPFSLNASYGPSGSLRVFLNGTITARSWALSGLVVGNNSTQTAQPGSPASFIVRFTTASGSGDNISIATEGSFGGANVSLNRSTIALGPAGSGNVTLTVTLPSTCAAGTYVDVTVRANSTSLPGITAAVSTRTYCAQVYLGNFTGPSSMNATVNTTLSQNYTLRNTGNGADNFTVTVTFNASLINVTWSPSSFSLAAAANGSLRLNFTLSAALADGTGVPFSIDAAYGPSGSRHVFLNGTVTVRSYGLSGLVLGNNSTQTGQPGAPVNFSVQFTTASGAGDNATVSAEGAFGGASVALNRSSLAIGPLGSALVTLSVTMPSNCSAGSFVDIQVRANSTSQPSVTTTVSTRTYCGQVFAANFSGPSSFAANANSTLAQNYTVRNLGNGADNFTLSATYNTSLLSVAFSPQSFSLANGTNGTARADFTVAYGVADGTVIPFSIDVAYGPSGSRHGFVNGSVTARSFGLTGTVLNNATQTSPPAVSVNFTVQFTTASGAGDNVTFAAEGSFGGATVSLNRTTAAMGALGSATVTLTVTLPSACAAGTSLDVQVRANSTGQPSSSFAVTTRTTCGQVFAANLSGAASIGAKVNATVGQNYTLRNAGNGADNLTLSATYNASLLTIAVSTTSHALAGGGNATVAVNFTLIAAVADGTVIPFSLDVSFGPSGTRHSYLNGTVTATAFPLTGTTLNNTSLQTVSPGATATFFMLFSTGSSAGDNVTLTLEGSYGAATVSLNRTAIAFAPLGSGTATLTVTLPASCAPDTAFDVVVRATSSSQTSSSAAVSTRTVCGHVFFATLSGPGAFVAIANITLSQNFSLQNAGNGAEDFTLSVTANSSLVSITVVQPAWSLAAGANATARVEFRVPEAVPDGTLVPFLLDAAFGPSGSHHVLFNGTLTVRSFRIVGTLVGNGSIQSAQAGVPVDFVVRFTTASMAGDLLDLSYEITWGNALAALDTPTLSLGSLGADTVTLSVTMPANCTTGDFVDVRVRANSTGEPTSTAAVATRTVCGVVFGGSLVGPVALSAVPGLTLSVDFTVQNDGSALDNFAISASGGTGSLSVSAPTQPVALFGGGSAVVQVTFTLAGGTPAGRAVAFTLDLSFGPAGAQHAFLYGTVTALRVSQLLVSFDAAPVETVEPGVARRINLTVSNGGNYDAFVTLALSAPNGFGVTIESTSLQIPMFSMTTVALWVTAAAGSAAGVEGVISVNVATATPPAAAQSSITVRVGQVYAVTLSGFASASEVPGTLVSFVLAAFNAGNGVDQVTVSIDSGPSGWSASVSPASFALDPGAAPSLVNFQATIPAGTLVGTVHQFTVRLSSAGAGVSATAVVTITVLPSPSFSSATVGPALPVAPDSTAAFEVTLSNTGNVVETYLVEPIGLPTGWRPGLPATQSVVVAPGTSAVVWVNVTPPATTLAGTQSFTIRVSVQGDPSRTSTMTQTVVIAARHQVEMDVSALVGNFSRGATVLVNITLRNLGNVAERLEITGSGAVANVSVEGSPVTLPAFGETIVQVRVRLRADQAEGEVLLSFTAASTDASASATLRLAVAAAGPAEIPPDNTAPAPENFLTSPAFLLAVAAAVAAVVAVLVLRRRRGSQG